MGSITNYMSTDTDRIVNSCSSFHAFWSIPVQVCTDDVKNSNNISFQFCLDCSNPLLALSASGLGLFSWTCIFHHFDSNQQMLGIKNRYFTFIFLVTFSGG